MIDLRQMMSKWFIAGLLLLSTACAHPSPQPPHPPAVTLVPLAIVVPGMQGTGTAYVDETGGGQTCTLENGYCVVNIRNTTLVSYLTVTSEKYKPYRYDALGLSGRPMQLWLASDADYKCAPTANYDCTQLDPLVSNFVPLPRLRANKWYFMLENGATFTAIETSDFALYHLYLLGVDIKPILQQRHDLGFNMLRVFGSFNGSLGHFVPAEHGDEYWTELPKFMDLAATYGFYVEFTVFADTTQWLPNVNDQIGHYNRVRLTLSDKTNVLIEAVNEANQTINKTDSLPLLSMSATLNSSHGSNGTGVWGVDPFWHYTSIHTNAEPEWQRKVGHNCFEIGWLIPAPNGWKGVCIANENKRPDQDGNLVHFYDAARGAALLSGGACFHSISGRSSVIMDGLDLAAAQQWVAGFRSVDLACQDGPYTHRSDLEGPGILRAYERPTPGHDCIVKIRQ